MPIIVSVEGNIGSGKTTLLQDLEHLTFSKPHLLVYEQVSKWVGVKDSTGKNILELFYSDQAKYSYIFQSYVLFSRVQHLLEAIRDHPDSIIICERCHLTDFWVFAKSLFELEKLNEIEWNVYKDWHQMVRTMFPIQMNGIIYNRASSEVCLNRIEKRSRLGESSIAIEYLNLLTEKHDDWLLASSSHHDTEPLDYKVLSLNGDVDYSDEEKRKAQLDEVVTFVNSLVHGC